MEKDQSRSSSGLRERPINEEMWKRYGGDGTGFVIGFDAQHPFFFRNRNGAPTNVLRKVIYTDQWTDNFWRNPYYLFLVKGLGWSYEQEWRMFKEFSECDECIGSDTTAVFLATLAPEIIKTVHFGPAYDAVQAEDDISMLMKYGSAPRYYRVRTNGQSGSLESEAI